MPKQAQASRQRDPQQVIQNMPAGVRWYSEDRLGNITIRNAYWKNSNRRLPLAARVALALTELCCRDGFGRVYTTVQHPETRHGMQQKVNYRSGVYFHEVPELYYAPEPWSAAEVEEWPKLRPIVQLNRLSARNDGVAEHRMVLTMDVQPFDQQPSRFELQAATTGAVTLYLSPKLHAGLTQDLRTRCTTQVPEAYGTSRAVGDFVTGWVYPGRADAWQRLQEFRITDGQALVGQIK